MATPVGLSDQELLSDANQRGNLDEVRGLIATGAEAKRPKSLLLAACR